MSGQRCHAEGCPVEIPGRLLMCLKHWRMVPYALKLAVWRHYRAGQEIDKCPSGGYMDAQQAAIAAVRAKEQP